MFAQAFIDEGFTVWWDAVLHSGETFDEVIEQRLRDAAAVVVLWSPRSVASRWVRAEATQADRRNKLAPAIIEPCDRPIIFELTHAADLCEWTGDITDHRWQTFVQDVRRLVDARKQESAAAGGPGHSPRPASAAPTPHHAHAASRPVQQPEASHTVPAGKAEHPIHQLHKGRQELEGDSQDELHCLELEDSELADELFIIDAAGVKIGRTAPAEIVLSHKSVSREHCIIGLANDELLVTDLNSTNGTYVDETRIRRATILPVGSTLRLGQISMKHTVLTRAEAMTRTNAVATASLQAGRFALTS